MEITALPVAGFDGAPVPNRFLRQDEATEHLAILLPGLGYSNDMPLLYFASQLMREHGADVLGVDYNYREVTDEEDLRRRMVADVTGAIREGMRQRPGYRDFTLIGKSIGTLGIAYVLENQLVPLETRCVWMTPLLNREWLRDRMLLHPGSSFVAIGTIDPHFDPVWLVQWQAATGGTLSIVERGNHSLAIPRDVPRSIAALGEVMAQLQDFLLLA